MLAARCSPCRFHSPRPLTVTFPLLLVMACLCLVLSGWVACPAEETAPSSDNPCTNGSFETLGRNNFPADWGPVGRDVTVSDDAHSGQRAVRLLRTADTPTSETGLNRTRLITVLKGGVDFWTRPSRRRVPV